MVTTLAEVVDEWLHRRDVHLRNERARACVIVVAAVLGAGCTKEECLEDLVGGGPGVLVIDAETEEEVCAAVVTARDGDYEEILAGSDAGCSGIHYFSGRSGWYQVSVVAPDYLPVTVLVTFQKLECGWQVWNEGPRDGLPGYATMVTIALTPDDGR
jgi:hypothetical protein